MIEDPKNKDACICPDNMIPNRDNNKCICPNNTVASLDLTTCYCD